MKNTIRTTAILADAKRAVRATNRWHRAIIRIFNATNVAIVGEPGSEIDGRNCYDPLGEERLRGPHAIVVQSVTNLTLRGNAVRDAGNYGLYTYQAADVEGLSGIELKVTPASGPFKVRSI